MENCLRYATVYRVVLEYFLDSLPDQKYKIYFCSLNDAHAWLAKPCNHNKTVSQMLMRYEYPEKNFR